MVKSTRSFRRCVSYDAVDAGCFLLSFVALLSLALRRKRRLSQALFLYPGSLFLPTEKKKKKNELGGWRDRSVQTVRLKGRSCGCAAPQMARSTSYRMLSFVSCVLYIAILFFRSCAPRGPTALLLLLFSDEPFPSILCLRKHSRAAALSACAGFVGSEATFSRGVERPRARTLHCCFHPSCG